MEGGAYKICMLSDDFVPAATGVGTHLQTIIPALLQKGHEVCVITTRRKGEPAIDCWKNIKVYRLATIPVFGFYQAVPLPATLFKIIDEFSPDIIHCHYLGYLLIQALRYAEKRGIPTIYTYHMTVDHLTQPWPMRPWRPLLQKLYVHYCNQFNRILVPSAKLAEEVRNYGISPPVEYLSNPIPFNHDQELRPVAKDAFIILFVGRLNPEKNVPLLLKAFAIFSSRWPQSELWIAGHGSMRGKLEDEAHGLGITDKTRFLGFLTHEELPAIYADCDVFVLPSRVETQGLVALEAMYFQKPVIVTSSIISAHELVDDGGNGFIVNPDEPTEMAERLLQLAGDPELRERLGLAGTTRADECEPIVVVEKLELQYKALFDLWSAKK